MEHMRPGSWRSDRGRTAFKHGLEWLMAHSLVLYLGATLVQRTWGLLNTDLGQLILTGPSRPRPVIR